MIQPAFDFTENARQSDPWTSHAAAERVADFGGKHIDIVMNTLRRFGPGTIDEIAKRCPLTSVQIARRLADAEKRGLAEPTGYTRPSASGRMERVWRAKTV